jgi:ankyrin repeat protein
MDKRTRTILEYCLLYHIVITYLLKQIDEQKVNIDLKDGDGATALHFAASRGHTPVVKWLLKRGAQIVVDKYGKSPVHDAAENEHREVYNA